MRPRQQNAPQGIGATFANGPSAPVGTVGIAETAANTEQLTYDDLTPTEQAVANLGVQPNALKPIGWLNDAHHDQLIKANALESNLARRIAAYTHIQKGEVQA